MNNESFYIQDGNFNTALRLPSFPESIKNQGKNLTEEEKDFTSWYIFSYINSLLERIFSRSVFKAFSKVFRKLERRFLMSYESFWAFNIDNYKQPRLIEEMRFLNDSVPIFLEKEDDKLYIISHFEEWSYLLEQAEFFQERWTPTTDLYGYEDINHSIRFLISIFSLYDKIATFEGYMFLKQMFYIFNFLAICNRKKIYQDGYKILKDFIAQPIEFPKFCKDLRYFSFNRSYTLKSNFFPDYQEQLDLLNNSSFHYKIQEYHYDRYPKEDLFLNFESKTFDLEDFEIMSIPREYDDEFLDLYSLKCYEILNNRYVEHLKQPNEFDLENLASESMIFIEEEVPYTLKFREARLKFGLPKLEEVDQFVFYARKAQLSAANKRYILINEYKTRYKIFYYNYFLKQIINTQKGHTLKNNYDQILRDQKFLTDYDHYLYFEIDLKKNGLQIPDKLIEITLRILENIYYIPFWKDYGKHYKDRRVYVKDNSFYIKNLGPHGLGLGNSNELETLIHLVIANMTGQKFILRNDDIVYGIKIKKTDDENYHLANLGSNIKTADNIIDTYIKTGNIINKKKIALLHNANRFCENYSVKGQYFTKNQKIHRIILDYSLTYLNLDLKKYILDLNY